MIEPADEVGPDAFTAPVDTGGGGTCDKAALLAELEGRPDALREWSTVLGVPQSEVAAYIGTLQPQILETDTDVTNHGLQDGRAYARQSRLVAGTAVLVDPNFSGEPITATPPNPDLDTSTSLPTTSIPTTTGPGSTTAPGSTPQPVTRCKCGNPLLPAFSPASPNNSLPGTTDGVETTEPSDDGYPPEDDSTPPEDETPPEENTPPADNTPPEDQGTPSPSGNILVD